MGSLRFRKQFKIAPGVKLTLNKQSVSATLGVRGRNLTYNTKGQRTMSVGVPGTGLWWRDTRKVGATARTAPVGARAATGGNFDAIGMMSETIRAALWETVSTTAVATNAVLGNTVQWVVPAIVSWEPPHRFDRSAGMLTMRIAGQACATPITAPRDLPNSRRRKLIRILRRQAAAYSLWVTDSSGCTLVGRYSSENEAFAAERELSDKVRAESDRAAMDAATRAGEVDWSTSDVDARRAYWTKRLGFNGKGNRP